MITDNRPNMAMTKKTALRNFLVAAGLALMSAGVTYAFFIYILFVRGLMR